MFLKQAMARICTGLLGVTVATLALSAAHLEIASGNDLGTFRVRYGESAPIAPGAGPDINRSGKGDRAAVAVMPHDTSRTVAIRIDQLTNTSVLIRVPANRADSEPAAVRNVPVTPVKLGPKEPSRKMVACEPVVSGLTEVARLLDSGRCVT